MSYCQPKTLQAGQYKTQKQSLRSNISMKISANDWNTFVTTILEELELFMKTTFLSYWKGKT
ncbi:MAG: hypothetical protein ACXAC6_05065 [Candidatus Hodarchaeales archaeon]